jgi:hypothetical protein
MSGAPSPAAVKPSPAFAAGWRAMAWVKVIFAPLSRSWRVFRRAVKLRRTVKLRREGEQGSPAPLFKST